MKRRAAVATAALAAAAALVAGCSSSTVTVQGQVAPSSSTGSVMGITADSYATCSLASPSPGTQVTLTDSSGKVIGTGTLGIWSHAHAAVSGVTSYNCDMPFTMKNVPH